MEVEEEVEDEEGEEEEKIDGMEDEMKKRSKMIVRWSQIFETRRK